MTDLYDTPLAKRVEAWQDAGRDIYIAGFTPDGERALIVDVTGQVVTSGSLGLTSGLGRWECGHAHYWNNGDVYRARFPRRE